MTWVKRLLSRRCVLCNEPMLDEDALEHMGERFWCHADCKRQHVQAVSKISDIQRFIHLES